MKKTCSARSLPQHRAHFSFVFALNSLIDSHVRELTRLGFTASITSKVKLRLDKQIYLVDSDTLGISGAQGIVYSSLIKTINA